MMFWTIFVFVISIDDVGIFVPVIIDNLLILCKAIATSPSSPSARPLPPPTAPPIRALRWRVEWCRFGRFGITGRNFQTNSWSMTVATLLWVGFFAMYFRGMLRGDHSTLGKVVETCDEFVSVFVSTSFFIAVGFFYFSACIRKNYRRQHGDGKSPKSRSTNSSDNATPTGATYCIIHFQIP